MFLPGSAFSLVDCVCKFKKLCIILTFYAERSHRQLCRHTYKSHPEFWIQPLGENIVVVDNDILIMNLPSSYSIRDQYRKKTVNYGKVLMHDSVNMLFLPK